MMNILWFLDQVSYVTYIYVFSHRFYLHFGYTFVVLNLVGESVYPAVLAHRSNMDEALRAVIDSAEMDGL